MKKVLSIPLGTDDTYGSQMRQREHVLSIIKEVYELYGFEPLQTPAFEHEDVFDGHHGEGEKIQFRFSDNKGESLVLRYDLTVPLARFIATHPDIPRPFKRYQIAPSFRDDSVDHGHHREFIQCDADTVGVSDPTSDSEVITMVALGLMRLGFQKFNIRINHRGIINGLAKHACGCCCDVLKVQRALDFSDKYIGSGITGLTEELQRRGLSSDEVNRLLPALNFTGSPRISPHAVIDVKLRCAQIWHSQLETRIFNS